MKGNVSVLVELVDSYILELTHQITSLKIEGMAKGTLSILRYAELAELENRLSYVQYKKDQALYINTDYKLIDKD
jgi:hypothetical protein